MRLMLKSFLLLVALIPALTEAQSASPPSIHGQAAILIDVNTGEVLYKKNDTMRTPIASTQKLLTGLLVARSGGLDETFVIEKADTLPEPTKLYFKEGDEYTRRSLLTAMIVRSPNDAAYALARDNAGTVAAFIEKMNAEAKRLGAEETHFANPNGLPHPEQYSTARDLAKIARAAYRNPVIRELIQLPGYDFNLADGRKAQLSNTNRVMKAYAFCNGMKTGYTNLSGHCLVASGSYGGREVIAVVLKSDRANVSNDATKLLEYGLGVNRQDHPRQEAM